MLVPLFIAGLIGAIGPQQPPAPRPAVESAAQLPRLVYRLPVSPSRMILEPAEMAALADAVEMRSREMLESHDIQDAATRRDLLAARRLAALVSGDPAAALAFARDASPSGEPGLGPDLLAAALLAPRVQDGRRDEDAVRSAVRERLQRRDASARAQAVALRRDWALASSAFRLGEITAFADPEWARNPEVGQEFAIALLRLWTEINLRNPHLKTLETELDTWLRAHPDRSLDIWSEREIGDDARSGDETVTIAVWDGVDPAVFADQLIVEPGDTPDGRDNDADGFVDEAEGLSFDERFRPTAGSLLPVPYAFQNQLPDYERYMRGIGDLAAGRDGDDVAFARNWRRRLQPEDVKAFEEGYGFYTDFNHGTHVAGVAMRDLPQARLVPVRMTFPRSSPPPLLDEAAAHRFVAMADAAIRYMRSRGVRLCNISWGYAPTDIEGNLAQNGVEADPQERARRARRIFEIMSDGFAAAVASAPGILFVIAAGNSGQDIDFVGDLPGGLNLPNLLTVGAADAEGRAASFASGGASVDLHARGTDVASVVPGGGRLLWSGASLAAPQVVNAAAKLLQRRPQLTAAELAAVLTRTATPAPGSELRLLDARAAWADLAGGGQAARTPTTQR